MNRVFLSALRTSSFLHYPLARSLTPSSVPRLLQGMGCAQTQRFQASFPQFRPRSATPFSAPMCEWNHMHETDPSLGFLFRAQYMGGNVHLVYFPQLRTRNEAKEAGTTRPDGSLALITSFSLCDRTKRISIILPTPFICRLLAVLDGSMNTVELATRSTQGTFTGNQEKYTFELACTSVLNDGNSTEWKVAFSPGEALMLQRFLAMALERNFGFPAYKERTQTRPPRPRLDDAKT